MKKKIIYTDEPMSTRIIKDFLPKPEDLVFKEEKKKVSFFSKRPQRKIKLHIK
jgi:hypothetical protein